MEKQQLTNSLAEQESLINGATHSMKSTYDALVGEHIGTQRKIEALEKELEELKKEKPSNPSD